MKKEYSIGVIVPTWNSSRHLKSCLTPFITSPLKPKILIIDSASSDDTVKIGKDLGAEVISIEAQDFNHGLTREKARQALKTDIIVMVTDDAYAANETLLEKLIEPLLKGEASLSYARQLPKMNAGFFESFPREFNYPAISHVRSIDDLEKWGSYTFFCSNSCAAYLNEALDEIGGFPDVILGEDTVVCATLLKKGHKIAYVSDALVYHSHSYSLKEEFKRYYATGKARKKYACLIFSGEKDQKRGSSFVKAMFKRLILEKPHLLPYALLSCAVKFLGYKLGSLKKY